MTKLGRQTEQSAQETKERIKAAALILFSEKGFDAVSLREISRNANVSHGLIRYHFGTKDDIWDTVFNDRIDYFVQLKKRLIHEDLKTLPANELFFQLTIHIALTLLHSSVLIKLVHREAYKNNSRIDRIINSNKYLDCSIVNLFQNVQSQGYLTDFTVDEYTSTLDSIAISPNINPILIRKLLINTNDKSTEGIFNQYTKTIIKIFAPHLGIDATSFIQDKLPTLIEEITKQKQFCSDLNLSHLDPHHKENE